MHSFECQNYCLSILAFVSPVFCLGDSQFLDVSASSCSSFCPHQFSDVRGEHNLHFSACLNFISILILATTPVSTIHTIMGVQAALFATKTCVFFLSNFSAGDPFGGVGFGTNIWKAISNFICLQKDVKLCLSPFELR